MSLASYAFGILQLLVVLACFGFSAFRIRSWLIPSFDGAPARLVESVLGVGMLIIAAELLGLFSLIHGWTLILSGLLLAAVCWLRVYPGETDEGLRPPQPAISNGARVFAFVVVAVLVAQWAAFVSYNLDHGITNFDSVWYHMPYAADIAQTGSSLSFHRTETVFLNWFYPQNSEIFQGASVALTGRDFVSIFINMGWLGLALLAGWCVGRPYGRPHLTMLASAVLLTTHTMVVREPGTGKNDIVAVALTLAVVAILINRGAAARDGRGRLSPDWIMAAAGLAAGLAAGTKVTALAPVAMITFTVLFATIDGRRLRAAAIWFVSAFVGGGFWYLRSLIASGNPLPQLESIGPLDLPGPERLQVGRQDFNVFHYITDLDIWRDYFLPGLESGFGSLWPLLILVALVGLLALAFRGPGRLCRAHGFAALVAIACYLITPLGAAGPEGDPTAFAINLRFLVPALAVALALVPLLPWFDRSRPRMLLVATLLGLFILAGHDDAIYQQPGKAFGLAFAFFAVVLPAVAWLSKERIHSATRVRRPFLVVVTGLGVGALLLSWPLSTTYFDSRYQDFEPQSGLAEPYRWANGLSDSTIGLAGTTAGFKQYGFFGEDLSNEVTYIGADAPNGGFNAIRQCDQFREAVNENDLDFLVTSPFLNFNDYEQPILSPEKAWIEGDPATSRINGPGPIGIWRIDGSLDPEGCSQLPPGGNSIPGLR